MNKEQLIAHLLAYSAEYARDALREPALSCNERFWSGKSEAFATAAAWLQDSEV